MASHTVENYLKTIFQLSVKTNPVVSTNAISELLGTKAATVSDMLKKLDDQGFIHYVKYQGVTLTSKGRLAATNIIRKHRLWEVFLVEKLEFTWDEVHDIAEELEHVHSDELINRLERFLGNPKFDPHGDPIPDREGNINRLNQIPLSELKVGQKATVTGVKDSSKEFLKYLDSQGIQLGQLLEIKDVFAYDQSRQINMAKKTISLSNQVCKNLYVTEEK